MIFDKCKILFTYVFYVFIIRKTFSTKSTIVKWSYVNCKAFINDLNIMCTNFSEDLNETNICHDWTIYNQSNIIYLPEECANKTYTIEKPTNNFINPIQKNFNITINHNYIIPKKYASNTNKYNKVKNCMKIYSQIVEEFSSEEDYKDSKKLRKKFNITDFCINTMLEVIEVFQNRVEFLINQSGTKLFQEVNMTMPEAISKEKKEVKNFQNLEPLNEENLNIVSDNEPKKDCIEYGLKSINEEILVCLKYE
jgi:hypothetical protein